MSSINTPSISQTSSSDTPANETEAWDNVKQIIGKERLTLGHHWSFNLRNDPRRFAFVLSRYKFAAKMAVPEPPREGNATRPKTHVLELGCSEGNSDGATEGACEVLGAPEAISVGSKVGTLSW